MLTSLYKRRKDGSVSVEECFYFQTETALSPDTLARLHWLLKEPDYVVRDTSSFDDNEVVEIGPRLSVETPFSSNAVDIFSAIDVPISRAEVSLRYRCPPGGQKAFIETHLTPLMRMTHEVYPSALTSFGERSMPEPVRYIAVGESGLDALVESNKGLGLGMDKGDLRYFTGLFQDLLRDPTDVELTQLGNANSEHSRHHYWRGKQVINGKEMPETLMEIVKSTLPKKSNSLMAFKDNSGIITGTFVDVLIPAMPGQPSYFIVRNLLQHITATGETHNHPTFKAPRPGAETGSGGCIRDKMAVGRGATVHVGFAGYFFGNLHIPDYPIPGEIIGGDTYGADATPLDILIEGSNGVSDYGNKYGEPLIGGWCRSFGQRINGVRREPRKPVLYCAGLGRLFDAGTYKRAPLTGMLIVRIGGPAYRIGVGGGSASSMMPGENTAELDLQSVQRGNAEMGTRVDRVIRTCAELLADNPIESIHDQGAGGPSNVLTELMEPLGGVIDIRKITVGDPTMSVRELWVAEFQEGYGLLVMPDNIERFKEICQREQVNCEVLGTITGDGFVVVHDSADGSSPVNLSLSDILSKIPQKTFHSERPNVVYEPLVRPKDLAIGDAFRMVLALPSVCSKGFLTRKVDRSVTGLVVQQQCCGPQQVPVADCAVTADGYFGRTGATASLGEQSIKMLLSPTAGARMALVEMLTNLAGTAISDISDIKCRANWMWAAKMPGEGALLYEAAVAMRDAMLQLLIAIDGGKDSLSMVADMGDEKAVAPGQLVIMGYAPVPDIEKVVTPVLTCGHLGYIDFGNGKNRLGGSALAQALGQLGDESPDIEDMPLVGRAFRAIQELVKSGDISAYHDRSDGGIITTVAEMCFAGNCGARLALPASVEDPLAWLFNEEAGMVFEYQTRNELAIKRILDAHKVPWSEIGYSVPVPTFTVVQGRQRLFVSSVTQIRLLWEETSTRIEEMQSNPETVREERLSHAERKSVQHRLSFIPQAPALIASGGPKVAVLREKGTNGDREMDAAWKTVGMEPVDVIMTDLLSGKVKDLDSFRGLVFPGGFAHADVFGSAKGWAATILFNQRLRKMFDRFYERPDTFSLGVCNGCQLMANIGWLPYSQGVPDDKQTRLVRNKSGRFESRWSPVRVQKCPSPLFRGMEGSLLAIWSAHGEGQYRFQDEQIENLVVEKELIPLVFVGPDGEPTEAYPHNPNSSPRGIAALCSEDGRHTSMMPHPERCFLKWQWPWMPDDFRHLEAAPWLQLFQNAADWCRKG